MCGKGIHRVELIDDEKYCYMDYFCDIGTRCHDGYEPLPPNHHLITEPCDCPLDEDDEDE